MPLKTLTINGFKSFADKTKIEFTNGITGIVGPNGSGKSNITEAIRWVMGEQSAKSLRGSHMPDIIFAGSALREPLNCAEVSLTFDNQGHELATAQKKVTVMRRLFRDGSSDFFLNNKACRLRDISDLFLTSGLGKASFSIISQGRVEEILNSKPEERRQIIEEAAGVFKFKQQKKQAQNELAATDENLNRVADIHRELQTRVEPLQKQASLAKDYQWQKRKYDHLYQQILALELADLQKQQNQKQARRQELTQISAKIDQQVQTAQEAREQQQAQLQEVEQQLEMQQAKLLQNSRAEETLTGEVSLSSERSEYRHANLSSLEKQYNELRASLAKQKQTLATTQQNVQHAQSQKAALDEAKAKLTAQNAEDQEDIAQRLEDLRADYVEALQAQTTIQNNLTYQQKAKQQNQTQQSQLSQRQQDQQTQHKQAKEAAAAADTKFVALKADLHAAQQVRHRTQNQFDQIQKDSQAQQETWYQQLEKFQQQKARYQSLAEVTEDHSGFYLGVRAVLDQRHHLQGLLGAVADLLTVPADYQVAIEQALGAQLQQVVALDTQAAQAAIAFLKAKRLGRATFLPLTTIKPRQINGHLLDTVQDLPGFLGVASDLVQCDTRLQTIKEHLLGQLLVATDLKHALVIANKIHYRARIVTLEGDILSPGGALTGGRMKQASRNLLNRHQELAQRQHELKQIQQDLNQRKEKLAQTKSSQQALHTALQQHDEKLQKINAKLQEAKQEAQVHAQALTQAEHEADTLNLQLQRLQKEARTITADLTEQEQQKQSSQQKVARLKEQMAQTQERLAHFSSQKENLAKQLNELKTQQAVAKLTLDNQQKLQQRQEKALEQQQQQITDLQQQRQQLTSSVSQSQTDIDTAKQKLAQLTQQVEQQQKEVQVLKQKRADLNEALKALQPESDRAYQLQKQTAKELEDVAVALNSVKTAMTSRLDELREAYQLSFEAAFAKLPKEVDLTALRKQLKLVKLALADIGEVNLHAIDEYQEVNQRYQFLTKQQDDLIEAREQLLKTMAEMDHEVITRFNATFQAIAQAFEAIFPKMFGGGKAKLELTDADHPLTTGIEINAQPPGKKLQHLSLLSGGERALTAITLLFAILKARPAPFSILDEVEASLDEANVVRFANYLQHYEDTTQFIVITHRKGTMTKVDRLYGVTMQESGVSKIISVALTDLPEMTSSDQAAVHEADKGR